MGNCNERGGGGVYEIGDWGNEGCTLAADEGVPASRDVEKMKGIPTVTDSSFVLVTVSLSLSLSPLRC